MYILTEYCSRIGVSTASAALLSFAFDTGLDEGVFDLTLPNNEDTKLRDFFSLAVKTEKKNVSSLNLH